MSPRSAAPDVIHTRQRLEALEDHALAPYGKRSRDSRGRAYPEEEPAERTAFQRDRDRVLHTTAFRRLEYKTQVFVNQEGDYYRTRLTHTLEVAQIGRTVARALGANEDLIEAICLSHDLGHPPFGHSGDVAPHRPRGRPARGPLGPGGLGRADPVGAVARERGLARPGTGRADPPSADPPPDRPGSGRPGAADHC